MTEYIDIVDETGNLTGETVSRKVVHEKGLWHRTVHIWVVNENRDVLLQKRSIKKESHPGLWDISCAGHISAGETSIGAAVKELDEELGIPAEASDFRLLFTDKTSFTHSNGAYVDNEIHDTYLFLKPVSIDRMIIDPEEVEEIRYISFDLFKKRVTDEDKTLVQHTDEYLQMIEILERGDKIFKC